VSKKVALPALQVLHAPVFYGATFSACAAVDVPDGQSIAEVCREAEFVIAPESDAGPSNVSVAGEKSIVLAQPEQDPSGPGTWWIWGAADNIRLPAWNAVKLAEKLVP
jgi:aspartate-semialdehyde dehydrogenase